MVDQQLESILAIRKTYKWYKKILFRLLLQSALSAHKVCQRDGSKRDFLKFLHDCVTVMIRQRHVSSGLLQKEAVRSHFASYMMDKKLPGKGAIEELTESGQM